MSPEKTPQTNSKESLRIEKDTLDKILLANETELRQNGILDTAIKSIPDYYDEYYPDLAQVYVTNVAARDSDNILSYIPMAPTIRFRLIPTDLKHKLRPVEVNVRMEEVSPDGKLIPTDGFSELEVGLVKDMLSFLRQAQNIGGLANMNSLFTGIHDREESKKRHPSNHNK